MLQWQVYSNVSEKGDLSKGGVSMSKTTRTEKGALEEKSYEGL